MDELRRDRAFIPLFLFCACGRLATWKCKGCNRYLCQEHAEAHPNCSDHCLIKQLEPVA